MREDTKHLQVNNPIESFGIHIECTQPGEFYIEAQFRSNGKDIGRHKLGHQYSDTELRRAVAEAISNWLDARIYRAKPPERMNILEEQKRILAEFNEEWSADGCYAGISMSMRIKEVGADSAKSPTDDQSICKPEQSGALPGECGENLLGRPPSLEGERTPVEQPGPRLFDADHARGESARAMVSEACRNSELRAYVYEPVSKFDQPVEFYTATCVDDLRRPLPSTDDSPKPVDGPNNATECGATGRPKGNRAPRQDKKPPRKA